MYLLKSFVPQAAAATLLIQQKLGYLCLKHLLDAKTILGTIRNLQPYVTYKISNEFSY